MGSQARSSLSLLSDQGPEKPLPCEKRRETKDALKPVRSCATSRCATRRISGDWPLACKCALRGIRFPTDHAIIERTHQTITAQAVLGQAYPSHSALWAGLDERRDVLNRHLPSRVLSYKPPLEAYPQAVHSGRSYRPDWEEELLSLEQVGTYLAQGRWFRGIRTNGCFDLGGYRYYLGNHFARRSVAIGFDSDTTALICQPEGSDETIRLPAQGLTKAELMGELAVLQALPIYQLALPFSLAAWRQLEYAHNLTGMIL